MKYIPADIYCLQPNAARVDALEAKVADLEQQLALQRSLYAAVIARVNRAERDAAKWEAIARGKGEVTE